MFTFRSGWVEAALPLLGSEQSFESRRYCGLQRRQVFVKHFPDQDGIEIVVSMPQMIAYAPYVAPRLARTQRLGVITEPLCRLA